MSVILGLIATVAAGMLPADTVVVLGTREVDMTGDGQVEILELVGVGTSLDSLDVTFSIKSAGRTLHSQSIRPLTRTLGYGSRRRTLSPAEHREYLRDFDDFFFAEEKFVSAQEFLVELQTSARRHIPLIPSVIASDRMRGAEPDSAAADEIWKEIQRRESKVFWVSIGGDGITAIAWSEADQRFYRLLECC